MFANNRGWAFNDKAGSLSRLERRANNANVVGSTPTLATGTNPLTSRDFGRDVFFTCCVLAKGLMKQKRVLFHLLNGTNKKI